ncbi:MAG: hypothetical protein V3V01_16780 [Acidimicrobiales bacterium]
MSELLPRSSAVETPPLLRLRCAPCDVAWSGEQESPCWVCGEPGTGLRTLVRFGGVEQLDLELDFDY